MVGAFHDPREVIAKARAEADGSVSLGLVSCHSSSVGLEAFQLDAGVVGGELPVDLGLDAVSGRLPSRDLVVQDLEGVNAAV